MADLRPARPVEAAALSKLCMISKAYWGYDDAFMEACREELTLSPTVFETAKVQVVEIDGRLAGMAQLELTGDAAVLDKLFIHPDFMGAGLGRALFDWVTSTARDAGAATITIDADPGAVPFYTRMGAVDDGHVPSGSIPGRFLPRLRFDLNGASS